MMVLVVGYVDTDTHATQSSCVHICNIYMCSLHAQLLAQRTRQNPKTRLHPALLLYHHALQL